MHIELLVHDTASSDPKWSEDETGLGVRTIDHPLVVLACTDPSVAPIVTTTAAQASKRRRIGCLLVSAPLLNAPRV